MKDKEKDKDKEKKNKRFLSPSFRKGAGKEKVKDENEEGDLINLNVCEEDDDEDQSPSPSKNRGKRSSKVPESPDKKTNIATVKSGHHHHHDEDEKSIRIDTHPIKGGHIKKVGTLTQAGKKEDGETKVNQDSYLVIEKPNKISDFNVYSVLDGHGVVGHQVSSFVTKYFQAFFKKNKKIICIDNENDMYYRLKKGNYDILHRAFKHAERDVGKSDIDANFSGTTCVMVFQVGERIICSNIGDSRAIMVKAGKIIELSIDQKPNDPEEKKRIIECGGEVSQYEEDGEASGPFRVWKKGEMYPGIAMSRSIGDLLASTLGVVAEPKMIEETIDKDTQFIVLASDGVWEFLPNQNVVDIVMPFYKKNDPDGACKALIEISTEWWKKEDIVIDDITVICIFF